VVERSCQAGDQSDSIPESDPIHEANKADSLTGRSCCGLYLEMELLRALGGLTSFELEVA
jgi:hypothetical protein